MRGNIDQWKHTYIRMCNQGVMTDIPGFYKGKTNDQFLANILTNMAEISATGLKYRNKP